MVPRVVQAVIWVFLSHHRPVASGMPASPPGYSVQKGDCGYPVCDTITPGPVHAPNASVLAAICNDTDGCEGFNSNGWLKRCLPPRCVKAVGGMEPSAPSWLYTKLSAPKPSPPPPPPPPVAARPDLHYPLEERAELARLRSPTVSQINATSGTAVLSDDGTSAVVSEGAVFGSWTVLSVLPKPACVVLEHLFANFAVMQYVGEAGVLLQLRSSVGLASTPQPRFNFTAADPSYFERATEPDDWLAQRARADSSNGESSYLDSWKYLAPSRDYGLLGAPEAGMKWIMNHDGRIKRATQYSAYEPDNASIPLQPSMGVILFDPAKHTARWPQGGGDFSDRKSGYVGRYLRVISHASFDRASSTGFTMLALSPADSTPESAPSILVRIADVSNATGLPEAYRYFAVSDNNRSHVPVGPYCTSPLQPVATAAEVMYSALYNEHVRWSQALAPAMQLHLPYSDRRVADMALGVITTGLSVFIRRFEPNYGTGAYWCVDCTFSQAQQYEPGYAVGDGKGCYCHAVPEQGGSLPLTVLALHGALLEFGMLDEAKSQVGFYFDHYIYSKPQVPGHLTPLPPAPPSAAVDKEPNAGCIFGPRMPQTAVLACAADQCKQYPTLVAAEAACVLDTTCTGIDQGGPQGGAQLFTTRSGAAKHSPYPSESGWLLMNAGKDGCRAQRVPDAGRFKWQLINMEGWKQLPEYNCTLADGISDYGRLVDLFVKTARCLRHSMSLFSLPLNESLWPATRLAPLIDTPDQVLA